MEGACTGKSDPNTCELSASGGGDQVGPGYGYCNPPKSPPVNPILPSGPKRATRNKYMADLRRSLTRYIGDNGQEVYLSGWCDLGMYCNAAVTPNGPAACVVGKREKWIKSLETNDVFI